eukprot:1161615-Pelagomonas_calceolata.AAC.12
MVVSRSMMRSGPTRLGWYMMTCTCKRSLAPEHNATHQGQAVGAKGRDQRIHATYCDQHNIRNLELTSLLKVLPCYMTAMQSACGRLSVILLDLILAPEHQISITPTHADSSTCMGLCYSSRYRQTLSNSMLNSYQSWNTTGNIYHSPGCMTRS